MSDVLKATYADLKTVKTRSTCQIILEMPIEALTDVVGLLGAPIPGGEVWVALARLKSGADSAPEVSEGKRGTLAQQAGILCNDHAFWNYLGADTRAPFDAATAAMLVRERCGVKSRSELDVNPAAAQTFRDLRADFKLWLSGIETEHSGFMPAREDAA